MDDLIPNIEYVGGHPILTEKINRIEKPSETSALGRDRANCHRKAWGRWNREKSTPVFRTVFEGERSRHCCGSK